VQVVGDGKVKKQSLQPGQAFNKNQVITLELL
ncbi:MAG: PASTA domain-containing protein, partial [Sphingobacteriales bacterium]